MKNSEIKKIKNNINSKSFKVNINGGNYFIKLYANKENFTKDFLIYQLLKRHNLNVPNLINYNLNEKKIIFKFLNGKKLKSFSKNNLSQIFRFLKNFQKIKRGYISLKKNKKNFYAKDNCIYLIDHYKNLNKRLRLIKKNFKNDKQVLNLIDKKVVSHFSKIKDLNYLLKKKISIKEILSPSDFGSHNMLRVKKKIFFFDFDYAGIDSPLKLKLDFLLNPNHKFSKIEYKKISKSFDKLFNLKIDNKIENLLIKINILKCLLIILGAIKKKTK